MELLKLFLLLGIVTCCAGYSTNGTYVAIVPSLLRPGRSLDISVQILSTSAEVSVTARVHYTDTMTRMYRTIAETTNVISNQGIVQLQIPTDATMKQYNVTIMGSGAITFTNTTLITTDFKTLSIFIQTDKVKYKPGKIVLFRAMAVYSNLKSYKGKFNITIEDPNKSKIKQWLGQTGQSGVFSGQLQLSEQPVLGVWKIKVTTDLNERKEKVLQFTVAEYVLPKFEVKVDLPKFLLATSESLPIAVTSKYTYGKNVRGKCVISVEIKTYSDWQRTNYNYITINRTIELKDGIAETKISREELIQLAGTKRCYNSMCYAPDECVAKYAMINEKLMRETILVRGEVTEELTGNVISTNATVKFEPFPLKLKFLESSPTTFKPGLNWTGMVQVTRIDGSPPVDVDFEDYKGGERKLNLQHSCYDPTTRKSVIENINYTIPRSGLVEMTFTPTENVTTCNLNVRHKFASTSRYLKKFLSAGKQGIQVSVPGLVSAVKVNTDVTFKVATTESIDRFYYQILSKGLIVKQELITMPAYGNTSTFTIQFTSHLCQKASPSARILAWYLTNKGEVIVDSMDFNVDGAMAHNVSLKFSEVEVEPGVDVSLTVHAHPESYVGLLAVDRSVLLMGGSNDITQDKVMSELRSYDSSKSSYSSRCCSWWWPVYSGGKDTYHVLQNAGVVALSDALIFKEYVKPIYYSRGSPGEIGGAERGQAGMAGPQGQQGLRGQAGAPAMNSSPDFNFADDGESVAEEETLQEPERVRTEFPETWIWTEETTGAEGEVTLTNQVPDTITSWVASAFAVSDQMGLGVTTDMAELNVLKPFFVSLNLPYSVIRGEEIALQITVFNYMKVDTRVLVTLEASEMFMVRHQDDPKNPTRGMSVERTVWVNAGDGALVSIWIIPQKLGQIPLKVTAKSSAAADAVERQLLVEPEGEPHEYSRNILVSHGATPKTYTENITVEYPTLGLVQDSIRAVFTSIGDIMGPSITGLDRLLRMPYGCGEQNMIKFAPNIYIMQYLQATSQLTNQIKTKALNFLDTGYQRELTYRRKDGSFSAFGNADKAGSMWLTAFVIRCFNQAKPYILVDQSIIDSAVNWIVTRQNKTGAFQEPEYGRVIHSDLQGGSSKGLGLTAYVLATLLENRNDVSDMRTQGRVDSAIRSATYQLENLLPSIKNDSYALSLVTYTLTLVNSNHARVAKNYLDALATIDGDKRYWKKDQPTPDHPVPYWRSYYYQAPSHDIEMTAYALLTYTKLGDGHDGMYIAAWLAAQRNSLGGYRSTQDTVIALQALSGFEAALGSKDHQDMDVTVYADGKSHSFERISKDRNNLLILQSYEIPHSISKVYVQATGTGIALIQMSIFYHQTEVEDTSGIELKVTSHTKSNGEVVVKACGRWKNTDSSGMVVMEINQLTAYKPVTDNIKSKWDGIKRFEESEKKLTLYLDELPNDRELCIDITSVNVAPVSNLQQAVVIVYPYYSPDVLPNLKLFGTTIVLSWCKGTTRDETIASWVLTYSYYSPDQQKSAFYLPDTLKKIQVCSSCPECCKGITTTPVPPYNHKDNCRPNPCQNGGKCQDELNNYLCFCTDGFRGVNCEIAENLGQGNVASIKDRNGNGAATISACVATLMTMLCATIVALL